MARWCCPASTPTSTRNPGTTSPAARRRRPRDARARHRPSAIRHAGAAARASASRAPRCGGLAPTRAAHGREAAASRRRCGPPPRPTNGATLAGPRASDRRRARSQTCRVIAAANAEEEALAIAVALREALEDAGQDRRAGDARPRARAPRAGRARALERRGRRFRRRRARRYARRRVRAACRRGRARRARAGHAAGAAQASAAAARRGRRRASRTRSRRSSRRCCAARARSPAPPGSRMRSRRSATISTKLHRADPRTRLTPGPVAERRRSGRRRSPTALKPLEAWRGRKQPLADLRRRASRRSSRRCRSERRGDGVAFAGPDGSALAQRVRGDRRQRARRRRGLPRRTIPTCSAPSSPKSPVRRPDRPGVRVRIYGLLEARLQRIDRVVLGGLVEGVWPPETRSDPWLSRPMRRELGLDLPERRISLIGARLRADARRARGRARLSRQARGRADGAVALRAAAGGGRGRDALGGGAAARRALSRHGRASSTAPTPSRGR